MSVQTVVEAIAITAELTQTQLSGTALAAMASDLMAEFNEESIMQALVRCRRELTGRLTLAAIIERAQANDTRPGGNEAWAIALSAFDEAATVVMNEEISEAMAVARPIMDSGDDIGARMAFRDAYERIVRQARENGKMRPNWYPSLGHDPAMRTEALRLGVERGLLSGQSVAAYLPAPISSEDAKRGNAIAGLLTGNVVDLPADPDFKARIRSLRAVLENKEAA